jgi:DNA primase
VAIGGSAPVTTLAAGKPRIDTEAIRHTHPIADVVSGYGIQLRRVGRALVGRCPFHEDRGRPNLHLYPSGRWICYRCDAHGDAIAFVQRLENLTFLEAVARLGSPTPHLGPVDVRRRSKRAWVRPARVRRDIVHSTTDRAVLAAATDLYANRLLADEAALSYMTGRGFPRELLQRYRVGFAADDELIAYLTWLRLPLSAAVRLGLLTLDGREFLGRRVVFPELRQGQPIWLVGRLLQAQHGRPSTEEPRYLGLPGPKPLMGWDEAIRDRRGVCIVEGPTDLLALRLWGVPGLALVGNPSPEKLTHLEQFDRMCLALDRDEAGRKTSARLAERFGDRAIVLELPAKDPGELATRADGEAQFRASIVRALRCRTNDPRDATPLEFASGEGSALTSWRTPYPVST